METPLCSHILKKWISLGLNDEGSTGSVPIEEMCMDRSGKVTKYYRGQEWGVGYKYN